jgi:hypothetical protein
MNNMNALARNAWKYVDRDKRPEKLQQIEYACLAPDTTNEIFDAIQILELVAGTAFLKRYGRDKATDNEKRSAGRKILENQDPLLDELELALDGFENSNRKVLLIKPAKAFGVFREMIQLYGAIALLDLLQEHGTIEAAKDAIPHKSKRNVWQNIGGQLIPVSDVQQMLKKVHTGKIDDWDAVHAWYEKEGQQYAHRKRQHALAALKELTGFDIHKSDKKSIQQVLAKAVTTREWMLQGIINSRKKDYDNSFRKMLYDTQEEMDTVMGAFDDNSFIQMEQQQFDEFKQRLDQVMKKLK